MNAWQPIATAPKDGTVIIVTGKLDWPEGADMAIALAKYWKIGRGGGWSRNNGYSMDFTCGCRPRYWMPFPALPNR